MQKNRHHRGNGTVGATVGLEPLETRWLFALNAFGNETTVPSKGTASFFSRQSAVAANGSYIIARADRLLTTDPHTMRITASRYNANGKLLGTLTLATFPEANTIAFSDVSVSMDADGGAVVAYSQDFDSGAIPSFVVNGFIKVVRITRDGAVGPTELIADGRVGQPSVSMDASGGYYVGWLKHYVASDPVESVQMRAFNADGSPRGPRFVALANTGTFNGNFSGIVNEQLQIGSTPDGSTAWFDVSQLGTNDHYAQIGRVSTKKSLDITTIGNQEVPFIDPALAVEADGSAFFVYPGPGATNGDSFTLIQHYGADFNAKGDPITLTGSKNPDNTDNPVLCATPGGGFITGYSQTLGPSGARIQTAYAREYAADGTAIDREPVILRQGAEKKGDTINVFNIGTDAHGQTLLVYEKQEGDSNVGHYIRLTTNIAAIDKSVLYLFGTSKADALSLKRKGAKVVASRGDIGVGFASKDVLAAVVNGFGGSDTIANLTTVPSTLHGGAGNDTLTGASGTDVLDGGAGDDRITQA